MDHDEQTTDSVTVHYKVHVSDTNKQLPTKPCVQF
jgi:hypothetical protein